MGVRESPRISGDIYSKLEDVVVICGVLHFSGGNNATACYVEGELK